MNNVAVISDVGREQARARFRWTPRRRAWAAVALTGSVLALSLLLDAAPEKPVLCLWRNMTGLPCPSCGMTRGFVALGHGHVREALRQNLAAPIVYAAFWAIFLMGARQWADGKERLLPLWTRGRWAIAWTTIGVLAVAWAVNLRRVLF